MDSGLDLDLDLDLDLTLSLDQDTEDDPLAGVEYTGDPERDTAAELSAFRSAFQERAEAEAARMRKATDSEYWFCVCFQSRPQVEEFLSKTGWDKPGSKYVDGLSIARKLGVPITPEKPMSLDAGRIDAKLATLSVRGE